MRRGSKICNTLVFRTTRTTFTKTFLIQLKFCLGFFLLYLLKLKDRHVYKQPSANTLNLCLIKSQQRFLATIPV